MTETEIAHHHELDANRKLLRAANEKINRILELHVRSHTGSCKECGGRFPCRTVEAASA